MLIYFHLYSFKKKTLDKQKCLHVNIRFIGINVDPVNPGASLFFQDVCHHAHNNNNKQHALCIIPITHINQLSPPINLPDAIL